MELTCCEFEILDFFKLPTKIPQHALKFVLYVVCNGGVKVGLCNQKNM